MAAPDLEQTLAMARTRHRASFGLLVLVAFVLAVGIGISLNRGLQDAVRLLGLVGVLPLAISLCFYHDATQRRIWAEQAHRVARRRGVSRKQDSAVEEPPCP